MSLILYASTETRFDHNGIGVLSDAISCEASTELNGLDEIALQYPVDGIHADQIALRALILSPRNHVDRPQPYRIYDISEPLNGIVTILARHISYDLSGIPVQPFSAATAPLAMKGLKDNAVIDCPFSFSTDKTTTANFLVTVPSAIRSLLGGQQGSILDTFGGEYEFDRYSVVLHTRRGADRGVSIRYGKNLTDLQQDKNCASVYTGVYPYWTGSEGQLVTLSEKIVRASGTYDYEKILPLDFTTEWETAPTETQLRARAQKYVEDNDIGVPTVSISVSFVQLADTAEYRNIAPLETVELGDTVSVYFPRMRVSASARVVAIQYDAILQRYISITLGSVKANIADTIAGQKEIAQQVAQQVVAGQTQMDIFNKLTNYGQVQGIYIQDGKWYINAEIVKVINLIADNVRSTGASVLGVDQELWITDSLFRMTHGGLLRLAIQLAEDGGPGIYLSDENEVTKTRITASGIRTPSLEFTGDGNCAWEYDSTLGKTILVQT